MIFLKNRLFTKYRFSALHRLNLLMFIDDPLCFACIIYAPTVLCILPPSALHALEISAKAATDWIKVMFTRNN